MEKQRLSRERESMRREMEPVVTNMSDGLILSDGNGSVRLINPAAKSLPSLPKATRKIDARFLREITGLDLQSMFTSVDILLAVSTRITLHHSEKKVLSMEMKKAPGSERVITVIRDVTQAEKTNRLKSHFISTASHELRTPLASMKNSAELVLGEPAGEINRDQKRFLSIANENINRLGRMTDNLLDLFKMESGKMRPNFSWTGLEELIYSTTNGLRLSAEKKGIDLHTVLPGELPEAWVDRDRIVQVPSNLLSNAIKFTPGGGRMTVGADPPRSDEDHIWVFVEDTGVGIETENLEKIFDKFKQVNSELTRKNGGTGLGLAIPREIVSLHEGRIWAEAEKGKGSKFAFSLPAESGNPSEEGN